MKKKIVLIITLILVAAFFSGCCFTHEWKEATCTEPKTCSKCNKTEGEPLGHEWKEATCTEPKTCARCGAVEGEALGHTASNEWKIIKEAKYKVPGLREKKCTVCGESVKEEEYTVSPYLLVARTFPEHIPDIKKMTDEQVDFLAQYSDGHEECSYDEAYEQLLFKENDVPKEIIRIVKNLRDKSLNALDDWSLENISIMKEDGVAGVVYNLYEYDIDTKFYFTFVFNTKTKEYSGMRFSGQTNGWSSSDLIAYYAVIISCVDEKIDDAELALAIIGNAYNKDYLYGDWVYKITIEDDVDFTIIPNF